MADPQLNERAIVSMLDTISTPASIERLVSAGFMSIIDSHDRKLERTEWVGIVQDAMGMADMLTRLEITVALHKRFNEKVLDEKVFTDAIKELTKRSEGLRESLKEKMELVAQCPYETDTKH